MTYDLGHVIYKNIMLPKRAISMCWVLFLSIAVLPVFTMIPSTFSGFNRIGYAVFGYILVPFFIVAFTYMSFTMSLEIHKNGVMQSIPLFKKMTIHFVDIKDIIKKDVGNMSQTTQCRVFLQQYDGRMIQIVNVGTPPQNEIYIILKKAFDAYKARKEHD